MPRPIGCALESEIKANAGTFSCLPADFKAKIGGNRYVNLAVTARRTIKKSHPSACCCIEYDNPLCLRFIPVNNSDEAQCYKQHFRFLFMRRFITPNHLKIFSIFSIVEKS